MNLCYNERGNDGDINMANTKNIEKMKEILEKKQAKSSSQRGIDGKIQGTIGEKRKKIYVKKTGGLFDK